jgi:hypothetical protein
MRIALVVVVVAALSLSPWSTPDARAQDKAAPLPAEKVFVGPDFNKGKPVLVDTLGGAETTFRALGGPGSKSKPSRWRMELEVVVYDPDLDDQDVLTAQLLRGRKKLGQPVVCSRVHQLGASSNPRMVLGYKLFAFKCEEKFRVTRDYKKMHDTKGAHTVKLSLKRVLKDKLVKDFAALKVNVVQLKQGAVNNPYRAWGTDHDMKLPVTMAYEKPLKISVGRRMRGGIERGSHALYGATGQYPTGLILTTWLKYDQQRPERTLVSCFHNGKKIGLKPVDALKGYKHKYRTYKGKKQVNHDYIQLRIELTRGGIMMRKIAGKTPNYRTPPHWIADNPGDYRCVAVQGGNIIKEFHFKVADGKLVPPACQAKSINTLHNVVLIETKTKSTGDAKWSKKAGKKLGFEGRVKWARGCPPVKR